MVARGTSVAFANSNRNHWPTQNHHLTMFRLTIVAVALVGVSLAYEHHGFISEVKHIPYKYIGGGGGGGDIGGGFGGSQGGFEGGIGLGGGYEGGEEYYSYPKYKYEYGVKDYKTGDHKSQWEMRDGDVVKGEYTLDEADGTKRIVEYYADSKNGFEAKVKNIGHAIGGEEGGLQEGGLGYGYSYSKLKKFN
ncbi:adult-specific cuticular protein ACP-20-like [Topomyia yanbarensis]|uniref:adult-specific cuticular protein ACP-20-like n=1 Tax=Topomyia yanbarensis TaxID=2498891 RepID=UPI00273BE4DF|nr:adult-specific cuticular protein ACP-20-like [Topomyia yanbarensis]